MNQTGQAQTANPTIRRAATAVGAVFLVVGILGFIPGVTTEYSQMSFAGHESGAMLFGIFQVSVLHNIVHLIFGVAGLVMARTVDGARSYLIGGGVVYLVLWIYGMVVDKDSVANIVPINTADNWLHLTLGAGMIAVGILLSRPITRSGDSRSMSRDPSSGTSDRVVKVGPVSSGRGLVGGPAEHARIGHCAVQAHRRS